MNANQILPTSDPKQVALKILMAVAETIREVGEAPSGPLYAGLMAQGCTLGQYQGIINTLKGAKLIEETDSHLLRWIGPSLPAGGAK